MTNIEHAPRVEQADIDLAGWFTRRIGGGESFRPQIERLLALHRSPQSSLLEEAREALCNYACHAGPTAPCARTSGQCAYECGKPAGDMIVKIDAFLARIEGEKK